MEGMEVDTRGNLEKKRKKRGKTILDDFSNLITPKENLRVKSTVNLLRHLSSNDEEQKKYALTRTIRGLGSSNKNARCGFFAALIGIFEVMDVSVQDVFECMEKELRGASGSSKGELADISAGRILTCGAVIRSKLWTGLNVEEKKKIVEILLDNGKTRSYLTLLSYIFIITAMEKERKGKKIFSLVKKVFEQPTVDWDMDTLFLWINTNKIYKGFFRKDFDLEELCQILTVIPGVAHLNHPLYKSIYSIDIIQDGLITSLDQILNSDPSRSKLLACIKIVTSFLENIQDESTIPSLISETFLEKILDYSKKKKPLDPDFQKLTDEFFRALQQSFSKPEVSGETKFLVLRKFLFKDSPLLFKMIRWMISDLDNVSVRSLADFLREAVAGSNDNLSNNDRLYAARLLVKLLNHRSVGPADRDWTVEQLKFLMDRGLFRVSDGRNLGTELTAALKATFFNALDLKSTNLEHLQFILKDLVSHLDRQLGTVNGKRSKLSLKIPLDEEIYGTWRKTITQIESIEGQKRKSPVNNVFLTLFLNMALQLFNDVKLATDSLEELFLCYEKSNKREGKKKNGVTKKKSKKSVVHEGEDAGDPIWIEVVIDLFLNLLSRNSHLLRSVINSVFPHLRHHLTTSAVHQILSVLDPEQEGGNPLMARVEDDDSNEEESGSEGGGDESDLDEEVEDYEADEEPGETEKLRLALHQVLSKDVDDQESVDLDDMSDGEAARLDEALSEAFRLHRPRRSSKRPLKSDQALVHFRVRVLDLLDIYLDEGKAPDEPSAVSLEHVLEIIPVLLKAVAFTVKTEHQGPFRDRLRTCLKKLAGLKKFRDVEVDEVDAARLLEEILGNSGNVARDMAEEVTLCSLFLIKYAGQNVEKVLVKHLEEYFCKRDGGAPYGFFVRLLGHTTWDGLPVLVPVLVRYLFDAETKWFKRNQSAELLKLFYNNRRFLNEQIGPCLRQTQEEFFQKLVEFLRSTQDVPGRYLSLLFDLLCAIETSPVKKFGIDWNDIKETIQARVAKSKDVKGAYRKLCAKLGIERGNKINMERKERKNGIKPGMKRTMENLESNNYNGVVEGDSTDGNGIQKRKKKRKK